ncbi:MAG: 16S rRNA (adenine(1518)-N(6)/adenine(1519)-N(6))-dimethyltransferase RsmA [Aestuariivita sp.]|nr:16S rRNA (adenine(1518)-N(6)/adenine(1519)-N(6))-dimethyltransferase RsmA [Aestuariivita sp.]
MRIIDDLPPLREVIAKYDLSARKSLGQNFLFDLNLTSSIARLAGDLTQYNILEIGPGPGGLTRSLLALGARRVIVIERDVRCLCALDEIAAIYPTRLKVVHANALDIDPKEYVQKPMKIIANLPFNIATELLIKWLTTEQWPPIWKSMTLMFQREVAERIVARPDTKAYGRLSILSQWRTNARLVKILPPEVFTPKPQVSGAVVTFEALSKDFFPADIRLLQEVVSKAFNQRRKMLRTTLKGYFTDIETTLASIGIHPTTRAENVSVEKYCELARKISKNTVNENGCKNESHQQK